MPFPFLNLKAGQAVNKSQKNPSERRFLEAGLGGVFKACLPGFRPGRQGRENDEVRIRRT
jgi:hypothetical protein